MMRVQVFIIILLDMHDKCKLQSRMSAWQYCWTVHSRCEDQDDVTSSTKYCMIRDVDCQPNTSIATVASAI